MKRLRIYILLLLVSNCFLAKAAYNDASNFIVPSNKRILTTQGLASWNDGTQEVYAQVYFGNTGGFNASQDYTFYVTRGKSFVFWRKDDDKVVWSYSANLPGSTLTTTPNNVANNGKLIINAKTLSIPANASLADGANLYVGKISSYRDRKILSDDRYVYFNIYLVRLKYRLQYDANGGTGTVPATWTSDWTDGGITFSEIYRVDQTYGIWDYKDLYTFSTTHALNNSPNITKAGYNFAGWSYSKNGDVISGDATISGSGKLETYYNKADNPVTTTVYAVWQAKPYTATFSVPSGASVSPTSTGYTIENTFTFPTATREGWKISSWKVTSVGSDSSGWTVGKTYTAGATSPSGAFGDVTFEAQWTPLYMYSLTYDVNGGTGGPSPSTVTSGSDWLTASTYTFNISSTNPTRENYTFLGWFDALTGGREIGTTYTVSGVGGSTAAKTIYANWKHNSHKVTGSIDHGTVSNNNQEVDHEGKSAVMKFTPASGYAITSMTEKLGTGSATAISGLTYPLSEYTYPQQTVTQDIAVASTTSPVTYTLTFAAGDGGTVNPTSKTYNIEQAISLPTATKPAYTFASWKVTTAGGNWSTSDAVYSGTVSAGKYGNATLTAQYTPANYTITYDANGGSVTSATQEYNIESTSTLAASATRPGYSFNGWKATSASAGSWTQNTVYSGGKSLTGSWGNVTLQAQWTKGGYKATFDANGGTVSPEYCDFTIEDAITLPVPTWTGHEFNGWKVSTAEGSWVKDSQYTDATIAKGNWGNVTLQAQWSAIPFGSLKIVVEGLEDGDGAVCTAVSAVDGSEYTVAVTSNDNTATLKNIYVGGCTVTSTGWQWNYDISESNPQTVTVKSGEIVTVTFTLSPKSDTPKHDESNIVNVISKENN